MALAPNFLSRPAVYVGVLARMIKSGRTDLIGYVIHAVQRDPSLTTRRSAGRTLLHTAKCRGVPGLGGIVAPARYGPRHTRWRKSHSALQRGERMRFRNTGPVVVQALVRAGADVNACGGVTRTTALHMAARRGHVEIARALLDCGAAIGARDIKGNTPLQRAVNCRKNAVAQLLKERATAASPDGNRDRRQARAQEQ
jgi:ankyrin repeat protein